MVRTYIGLGTNLGNREENLARARDMIGSIKESRIVAASSIYQTEPWGKTDQPSFLNQVLALETALEPMELLGWLHDIEQDIGRKRMEVWGPRIIDLDILLFGDQIINEPNLVVPHPYMLQRTFVLIPLLELDPALKMPDGREIKKMFDSFDKLSSSGCELYTSMLK